MKRTPSAEEFNLVNQFLPGKTAEQAYQIGLACAFCWQQCSYIAPELLARAAAAPSLADVYELSQEWAREHQW